MRIQTHVESPARLVVGRCTRAIHIGVGGGVTHGLGITRAELTFVEHVINTGGYADIFSRHVGAAQANHRIWADFILLTSGYGLIGEDAAMVFIS